MLLSKNKFMGNGLNVTSHQSGRPNEKSGTARGNTQSPMGDR